MTVSRPYRRTIRQFADGQYSACRGTYIRHPRFCQEPEHFIRAFALIQKDLIELFEYVEPDDINLTTYSYRIHELLVRTCIEVEANFKAILCENAYRKKGNWTLTDYHKIEKSHFLSKYEVKLPTWRTKARRREPANGIREKAKIFTPFEKWAACHELSWYREYNAVKHDRHSSFKKANLENLLNAVSGLVALLSSQFYDECFSSSFGIATASSRIIQGGPRFMFGSHDGYDDAVGGYFKVKWPKNMPEEDRYDFDWQKLGPEQDPFDNFPYGC